MIDILENLRNYIITDTRITSIVSQRVYPNWFPEKPTFPFIVLRLVSGKIESECPVRDVTIETRCYSNSETQAHDTDNVLMDVLTGINATDDSAYINNINGYGFQYITNSAIGTVQIDQVANKNGFAEWIYSMAEYETEILN